jgi:hypothetical protein
MGMYDIKRIIQRFVGKIGKEKLIQEAGFGQELWNLMKGNLFISLKRPFLGKRMDIVLPGKAPGYFQGIFFSTPGGDKITDEDSDLQFLLR